MILILPRPSLLKHHLERFSNTSVVVTLTFDEAVTGLTTNVLDFSDTTSNVASFDFYLAILLI